jgi:hypothetical protein
MKYSGPKFRGNQSKKSRPSPKLTGLDEYTRPLATSLSTAREAALRDIPELSDKWVMTSLESITAVSSKSETFAGFNARRPISKILSLRA